MKRWLQPATLAPWLPDLARGVRGAFGVLIPFYLAGKLGRPELGWTAIGGWLGTLADPPGTRRSRAETLVVFSLLGAVSLFFAELWSTSTWSAAIFLSAVTFATAFFRSLGSAASTVGTLITILVALASAKWTTRGGQAAPALEDSLYFLFGAGWATVLSTLLWPVWTHLPARRKIADAYGQLAGFAGDIASAVEHRLPAGDAEWTRITRERHRAVRSAFEAAREIVLETRSRRSGESQVGSNLRVLLGRAEAQFFLLITLAEELEAESPSARPKSEQLASLGQSFTAIDRALNAPLGKILAPPRGPRVPPSSAPESPLLSRLIQASGTSLLLAQQLGTPTDAAEGPATEIRRVSLRDLLDALSPRTHYFHHGLRVAAAVLVASLVGYRFSSHPQWVTLTTLAVLQPYSGATVSRVAQRVVGTVIGSLVAVILSTFFPPWAITLVMFPLCVGAVFTQPRSYRLFTIFLTPVFVLFAERYSGDWVTAALRSEDALIGGAIGLVFGVLVFPSRESRRLPDLLAAMLDALASYVEAELGSLGSPRTPEASARIAAARRATGLALNEAEASLERQLAEPRPLAEIRKRRQSQVATLLITYARRAASSVTSIDTRLAFSENAPITPLDAELIAKCRAYAEKTLSGASICLREDKPPVITADVPLPETSNPLEAALTRLTRYLMLVAVTLRPDQR